MTYLNTKCIRCIMYKVQASSHFDVLQILHRYFTSWSLCVTSWSLCVTSCCASETRTGKAHNRGNTTYTRDKRFVYVVLLLLCNSPVLIVAFYLPPKRLMVFYINNKFQLRPSVIKMDLILFLFSVFLSRKTN